MITVDGRDIFTANIHTVRNKPNTGYVDAYVWPLPYIEVTDDLYGLLVQARKETAWAEEKTRTDSDAATPYFKDKFTQKLHMRRLRAFKVIFTYLFEMGEKFPIEWPIELAEEFDWIAARIEGLTI